MAANKIPKVEKDHMAKVNFKEIVLKAKQERGRIKEKINKRLNETDGKPKSRKRKRIADDGQTQGNSTRKRTRI